jgi:hypothetical protein
MITDNVYIPQDCVTKSPCTYMLGVCRVESCRPIKSYPLSAVQAVLSMRDRYTQANAGEITRPRLCLCLIGKRLETSVNSSKFMVHGNSTNLFSNTTLFCTAQVLSLHTLCVGFVGTEVETTGEVGHVHMTDGSDDDVTFNSTTYIRMREAANTTTIYTFRTFLFKYHHARCALILAVSEPVSPNAPSFRLWQARRRAQRGFGAVLTNWAV